MTSINARLAALGVVLEPAVPVAAGYTPRFEPFARSGAQIHLSGRLAKRGGQLLVGRVGDGISVEEAQVAARGIAIEHLGVLQQAIGDLERVTRIVRLLVLVNGAPDFTEPHRVADGASGLFLDVLGERGRHARSAMVAAGLPFGAAVEIEVLAEAGSY
jgi:enamine deaminase RidA (YjgF/YER057c/UK114 family)